jgi:hypothetical protein
VEGFSFVTLERKMMMSAEEIIWSQARQINIRIGKIKNVGAL